MREEGGRVADAGSRPRQGRRLRGRVRVARRRQRAVVAVVSQRRRQRSGAGREAGGMSAAEATGATLAAAPDEAAEESGTREMTYLEAISDALRTEMRRDEAVFCLAEDAIIGAAVGAAVEGLKPVCEMQFADFIACGFDQLVNVAAKLHYRQGVAVPIVIRLPSGGGFSGGPFHSQNPEAWFLQAPGLKVVAPATAADAKGLLVSAIRDPNPVCYLEHKGLYRHVKGEVPTGEHTVPIGEVAVVREGS